MFLFRKKPLTREEVVFMLERTGTSARLALRGQDMKGLDLSRLDLHEANLSKANLSEANLELANLSKANLELANLKKANLSEANLEGAVLGGTSVHEANLERVNLHEAILSQANLSGANLRGADLHGALLWGAILSQANLSGANLRGANLEPMPFRRFLLPTNLAGANLSGATLEGANLSGATLEGANLSGANLRDADLEGANLAGVTLEGASWPAIYRSFQLRVGNQAMSRNGNLPLVPIDFTYQLPEGWIEIEKSPKIDELAILISPPGTPSLLELHVYQYMEESITDQEQFKGVTYRNLLKRGKTIVEDKISMRHGVISHETSFKSFTSYGFVVCFVIRSNLFLIMWSSSNIETFRRYRPKMEEFIGSLRFT